MTPERAKEIYREIVDSMNKGKSDDVIAARLFDVSKEDLIAVIRLVLEKR